MLSPARRRAAALWWCALLCCLPTARAFSPSQVLRGAAFLGCIYRAHATLGVDKEIVDSALVFDGGAVASGLSDNNDAVQCLRAAIAEVLTKGIARGGGDAAPWVNTVEATAYRDSEGEQDSKVTFSISMSGIDAQTVLDDLMSAAVDTTNLIAQLNLCGWPYDAIDKKNTNHVLRTETFQRATVASVGAVVSSALVFDGFSARQFNADSVARFKFIQVVASILSASTLQIDNVLAEELLGHPVMIRFDVAVHAWPIGAVVLETKEAVAQELKNALVDGQVEAALTLYAVDCKCVLEYGVLNVEESDLKIDEVTMHGTHVITSPPVPCTDCGGGDDDDDDLGAGARIAIAMAAVLCVVCPHFTGLGGDGFWLITQPGAPVRGMSGVGQAAAALPPPSGPVPLRGGASAQHRQEDREGGGAALRRARGSRAPTLPARLLQERALPRARAESSRRGGARAGGNRGRGARAKGGAGGNRPPREEVQAPCQEPEEEAAKVLR